MPTKVTAFSVDGYDLSAQIADWFGTANLPADGTISVAMRSYEVDVPTDVVFKFGGVDGNGQRWSKQISLPFLGKKETTSGPGAAISLVSVPESVVKSGKGDPNDVPKFFVCPTPAGFARPTRAVVVLALLAYRIFERVRGTAGEGRVAMASAMGARAEAKRTK